MTRRTKMDLAQLFPTIICVSLIIRLAIMPFALNIDPGFGSDLFILNSQSQSIFSTAPPDRLLYPILTHYTIYSINWLLGPLTPSNTIPLSETLLSQAFDSWIRDPSVFRNVFFIKSWTLIFETMAVFTLWKMMKDNSLAKARRAVVFWSLNPLIIYDVAFHGQLDVIPLLFTVLAMLAGRNRRASLSVLALGLGGCYKNYPLLFILPAIAILGRSWQERLKLLTIGIAPYLLLMLPVAPLYRVSVGNYPNWLLKGGYDLGYGARVYIFFAFYAILLWYLHRNTNHSFQSLWRACFAILLVYYQFSLFELHYWVWIVPFAIIYWVEHPEEAKPFYLVIGLCLLVLTANRPLGRYLAPISPRFFLRLPSLLEVLNPYLPMTFLLNIVRSLLAGTSFYLAWKLVRGIGKPDAYPPRQIAIEGSASQ